MGTLYYGECWLTATVLDILKRYLKDESVVVLAPFCGSSRREEAQVSPLEKSQSLVTSAATGGRHLPRPHRRRARHAERSRHAGRGGQISIPIVGAGPRLHLPCRAEERLAELKDWTEEELIEHFERWAQHPRVRESICGSCLSEEERSRRIREIFGLSPEPDPAIAPEANPTKSN